MLRKHYWAYRGAYMSKKKVALITSSLIFVSILSFTSFQLGLNLLVQLFITGTMLSGLYILVASGLSLTFGVMKIINVAHGELLVFSAYLAYWLNVFYGLDPLLSAPLVAALLFPLGIGIQRFLFNPALRVGVDQPLLISFGLVAVLQSIMMLLWTADPRGIRILTQPILVPSTNIIIPYARAVVFAVGLAMACILKIFLTQTFTGKCIRATAQDMVAASLMGLNVDRINVIAFSLGIVLTAIAGTFASLVYSFDPTIGLHFYLLKAFAVIILGGVGSIEGMVLGSFLMGQIEAFSSYYLGDNIRDAVGYIILLVFLILKPTGLLAKVRTW
jgi:branched-chain amino acid transport system permease protein